MLILFYFCGIMEGRIYQHTLSSVTEEKPIFNQIPGQISNLVTWEAGYGKSPSEKDNVNFQRTQINSQRDI